MKAHGRAISRGEDQEVARSRQQGALTREVEAIHAAKKRTATPVEVQPPVQDEEGEEIEEDEEESEDGDEGEGTKDTHIEVREVVARREASKAVEVKPKPRTEGATTGALPKR